MMINHFSKKSGSSTKSEAHTHSSFSEKIQGKFKLDVTTQMKENFQGPGSFVNH